AVAAGEPAAGVVSAVAAGEPGGGALGFPGQGSQWPGMAAALLESCPVFAAGIAECAAALAPFTGWDLEAVLRGQASAAPLERVDVVHPALWAVMVSLARVW